MTQYVDGFVTPVPKKNVAGAISESASSSIGAATSRMDSLENCRNFGQLRKNVRSCRSAVYRFVVLVTDRWFGPALTQP